MPPPGAAPPRTRRALADAALENKENAPPPASKTRAAEKAAPAVAGVEVAAEAPAEVRAGPIQHRVPLVGAGLSCVGWRPNNVHQLVQ